MALVITLSLLVLVTIAIMAFFTRATANRAVETSRANQVVARQIAATAADYALGSLLSEISQNATISGPANQPWYQVTNAAGALPRRAVASAVSGGDFTNLVRQSVPAADTNASEHNSAAASQNGRLIPAARWNEPRLNFGTGFTTTNQLPNWIYLNRDGSVTDAPSTNAVGRFAYNLYDVSGLLDANIAGNPNLAGSDLMEIKSTQAGADLTALGINQTAINQLAAFRSPQATNGTAFKNAVLAWQGGGFLEPEVDVGGSSIRKMSFANRGDLIRYATRENTDLISALPSLTHFSLSSNTPGVAVDADDNNVPDIAPLRRTSAATITRYHDDGTPFQVSKLPGDTLLDRRFSLAKLAWLTHTGPAPGISNEAIQSCFGLRWNPTERRWDYVGHEGTTVRDELSTLAQVGAQNRDPNFFELLYAGIGRDSMDLGMGRLWGLVGNADAAQWGVENNKSSYTGEDGFIFDSSPQFQAVQIGVNILDQADGDNFPSSIRFFNSDFNGTEDLPLISGVFTKPYFLHQGTNGSQFGDPPVSVWLIPQFWNPHRLTVTPSAGASPQRFRLEISGNSNWRISMSIPNPSPSNPNRRATVHASEVASPISEVVEFSLSSSSQFRSIPGFLQPGNGTTGPTVSPPGLNSSQFVAAIGVSAGVFPGPWPASFLLSGSPPYPAGTASNGNPNSPRLHMEVNNLRFILSYQDAVGDWRPYSVFGGKSLITPPLTGSASASVNHSGLSVSDLFRACPPGPGPHILRALDPRTGRFGLTFTTQTTVPGFGGPPDYSNSTISPASNQQLVAAMGYTHQAPNAFPSPSTFNSGGWGGNVPTARFWSNTENIARYADRDGVFRPADGALAGNTANAMFASATGAANATTDSDRTRPIILQRPFRSVAELGYVFRDQPWKTLDFFSAQSADAALLDLFCVSEAEGELTAGKLNPRSSPAAVLEAVLRQTPYDEVFARNPGIAGGRVSNADATTIAGSFKANSSNLTDSTGLPSLVSANHLALSGTLAKPSREAAVRTLMGVADFKTWRIFGDIIVQAGRFAGGTSPDRFVVESEERLWLSSAIDRNTGRILFRDSEFPVP